MEDALQAAELKFGAAFERSPIGMALTEPSGRFLIANPALCQLLGRDKAQLWELKFADFTHGDDATSDNGPISRMLRVRSRAIRSRSATSDPMGRRYGVLETVSLVRDRAGHPDYFFVQVQNLTERRSVEREASYRVARQAAFSGLALRSAMSTMSLELLMDEAVDAVAIVDVDLAESLGLVTLPPPRPAAGDLRTSLSDRAPHG